jgi:hypothetical protein
VITLAVKSSRPSALSTDRNDGAGTGRYRTALNENVRNAWSISRADLADYVVRHLEDTTSLRATVAIAS